MKKSSILTFFLLICLAFSAQSQIWGTFPGAISLPDTTQRTDLTNVLDTMSINGIDSLVQSGVLDSLLSSLHGANPFDPNAADSTAWGNAGDLIANGLDTTLFSSLDSMGILNQFDSLNVDWFNNLDSLGSGFDSLGFPPLLPIRDSLSNDEDWNAGQDSLYNDLIGALDSTSATGFKDKITALVDTLFNPSSFKIILYGGTQDVKFLRFYNFESKSFNTAVVGVRSERDFRQPLFASWDLWGSFNKVPIASIGDDTNPSQQEGGNVFNPFELGGNFTVFKTFGGVGLRAISGLGFGAHTYAPAHKDLNAPFTSNNKGYTTACTVEISGGLSFTVTEDFNVYALATVGSGIVAESPYKYRGSRYEAAVAFGRYSLRYTIADSVWASNFRKQVKSHIVTVGFRL